MNYIPIGQICRKESFTLAFLANLAVTANAESVRLNWSASPDPDVAGYTIFHSESAGGPYSTIARNINSTSFVDNTTTISKQYFYTIKAVDRSLNR
jgi:fibronectin type 3 domain-containing protein